VRCCGGHPGGRAEEVPVAKPGSRAMTMAVLGCIAAYRVLFAWMFAGSCRHWPSCSSYAAEAVSRHGVMKGGWLALRRLGRCHPWGGWGHDPVP